MNEMDLLSRLRAEVPDRVSARAETRFHAALFDEMSPPQGSRHAARRDRRKAGWLSLPKLSLAAGLAVAAAAAVFVAVPHSPSHPAAGPFTPQATATKHPASTAPATTAPAATGQVPTATTLTVAELTDRASAAALARKPAAPTQWLYIKLTHITVTYMGGTAHSSTSSDETWQRADNQQSAEIDLGQHRMYQGSLEYVSLAELSSLPADPRALVEYVYGKVPDGPGNMRWSQTFEALINLFDYYNMPSATAAEVIQAFQYIPGVKAVTDPGDVAFSLNEEKGFMIAKALFDPTTYRLMGISRTIGLDPAHPERPPMETETTLQAPWIPVSGPFVRP